MTEDAKTKPSFEVSPDTWALTDFLRKSVVGQIVTYQEMAGILGRDVQNGGRHVLQSARRRLEREDILFGTVWRVGVKRLNDAEIVDQAAHDVDGIRRRADRAAKRTLRANYSQLSGEQRLQFNTRTTLLAIIAKIASKPKVKQLEEAVKTEEGRLPLAKTLEVFSR